MSEASDSVTRVHVRPVQWFSFKSKLGGGSRRIDRRQSANENWDVKTPTVAPLFTASVPPFPELSNMRGLTVVTLLPSRNVPIHKTHPSPAHLLGLNSSLAHAYTHTSCCLWVASVWLTSGPVGENENAMMTHPGAHRPSVLWRAQRLWTYKIGTEWELLWSAFCLPVCVFFLLCSLCPEKWTGCLPSRGVGRPMQILFLFLHTGITTGFPHWLKRGLFCRFLSTCDPD